MKLTVAMVAWPNSPERGSYLGRSLASIAKHLISTAPEHDLEIDFKIGAETEGISPETREKMTAFIEAGKVPVKVYWREKRANLGGNMNDLLDQCGDAHFVLLTQDDWIIKSGFSVSPYLEFLRTNPDYAMVRLAYSENPEHTRLGPAMFQSREVVTKMGRSMQHTRMRYLDPRSPYFYGDQPHLRRGPGHGDLPRYVEGGGVGEPEVGMSAALQQSKWNIAVSDFQVFEHCGVTSSVTPDKR